MADHNTNLLTWMRGDNIQLTENFNTNEFECKDGVCVLQGIDLVSVDKLQFMRNDINEVKGSLTMPIKMNFKDTPIIVLSGHRCYYHNKAERGAKNSKHPLLVANDIKAPHWTPIELYRVARKYFKRIGVARWGLHVDNYPGEFLWAYDENNNVIKEDDGTTRNFTHEEILTLDFN